LVHALSLLTDLRQNGDVVFELPDVFPEVGIGARSDPRYAGAISARRGLSLGRADRVRVHGTRPRPG
jgi:hypothetical protein